MKDDRGLRVAIYARYSTDRQDSRSIEDQIRRCRAFAQARGYEVVAEYEDAAQSGAHLDREGMQRLLAASKDRRRSLFRGVLVDDLSRLSRDLGNTWRLVFEDLASVHVRVIDCTTGAASDDHGARLIFGAMSLVNDTFLQLVKTETHRGLEGRAIAGFSTGGRVYGYVTEPEPNPPDPEHPRQVILIHDVQAAVVRRIFRLYAEGRSFAAVAALLNHEGIAAPYDTGGYSKRAGKGWGHTTIRAMLRNERYVGRFTWNRRKWTRSAKTGKRVCVLRPEDEHVVRTVPELAIIDPELWAAVQKRLATARRTRGRPAGASKYPNLLSGLLRCGVCGASMIVIGMRMIRDKRSPVFGCGAHKSKGSAVCSNSRTIVESRLVRLLIDNVLDTLEDPATRERYLAAFEAEVARYQPATDAERVGLEREIAETQGRIGRLTDALARVGFSDALGNQLRAEETRLNGRRQRLAALAPVVAAAIPRPDPEKLILYLRRVEKLALEAPAEARELLEGLIGPVVLVPVEKDGKRFYEARTALKLCGPVSEDGNRAAEKVGCGGRI
ncbi:MAG: recombinase family protein [Anaeromyxobacter sp.]